LISLNAKNAKLVPLSTYKKREEILATLDSNNNNNINHHNSVKNLKRIVQEMSNNDDIFDLINLKDDENTCFYDIKIQNEHKQLIDYKLVNKSSLNSIDSNISSNINKPTHLITPFEVSNSNHSNLESPTVISSSSSASSLKVEYVPHGKIITINVSIMW
jgi:hypothetical protein